MLLERGDEVVSVDDFSTGRPEHLPEQENPTLITGTIADKELVYSTIEDHKPDGYHTAASYKIQTTGGVTIR